MSTQDQFIPMHLKASHWPITILHKNQKNFLEEVVNKSLETLCERYPMDSSIYDILKQTTAKELARIASNPWPCDPKDDYFFWQTIASSIENKIEAKLLLKHIIERYVKEICSRFSVRHYQYIATCTHYTFINLLKPHFFGFKPVKWTLPSKRLEDKFHVMGQTDMLRSLAKIGTLILVPTHTSNWDSMVIGLAMKQLGLPPLTWGAGLNLFNNKGFSFIFNKMGPYKVDRRKKTIPYLQTQKDYASLILQWGCHTLFYPGGTRSRLGAIESDLKLGLLSTPFEAQANNFLKQGKNAKKLFIVPIVLNYHCVLEAYQLIRESIQQTTTHSATIEQNSCCTHLIFSKNVLFKGSELFINIGTPLDVMGNRIDIKGCSYDEQGQAIDDLYEAFAHLSIETGSRKPLEQPVKALSNRIIATYCRINTVLSSHLVAFVAYELAQKKEGFTMDLPNIIIPYNDFMVSFGDTYKALEELYREKKIDFTPIVQSGQLDLIAKDGWTKLGVYHPRKPLVVTKSGDLLIRDLLTLYYYHNRLTGYGLEEIFAQ